MSRMLSVLRKRSLPEAFDTVLALWRDDVIAPGCCIAASTFMFAAVAMAAMAVANGRGLRGAALVVVTLYVAGFWSYASHRWLAHERMVPWLWELHRRHHEPVPACNTRTAVACEFLANVIGGGIVLMPLACVGLLDASALVFNIAMFMSVHLINYHDGGANSAVHREHHRHPHTNFAPPIFDHVLGTLGTLDKPEQVNHVTPNIVFCLLLALAWEVARRL